MTFGLYVIWVVQTIIAYAILFLIQMPVRRHAGWIVRAVVFVIKLVALVGIAYLSMAVDTWVTWHMTYTLGAFYLAFFGDILSDLVSLPVVIIRKRENCMTIQAIISLVLTIAVLIYGAANMQSIKQNELTYTSEKLTRRHRFVFISDLHAGTAQNPEVIEDAMFEIASVKPDFIVLGGDITDEFTTLEEMQTTYSLLSALDVPVYFIYGNHDRQAKSDRAGGAKYTEEELEKTLRDYGIIVLKDNWVRISEDLVLLGREDSSVDSRLSVEELKARPENAYVVCVDHSPYQTEDIIATKADLQLSGHSHAGQLFPLQLLYNTAGYDAYGEYHYGDTDLYVSSGIAGWAFPLRTEEHCYYEVVNLVPAAYR